MIKILKEGDYFGEIGIMEQKLRSASIIANENLELAVITKEDFLKVLETAQQLQVMKLTEQLRDFPHLSHIHMRSLKELATTIS